MNMRAVICDVGVLACQRGGIGRRLNRFPIDTL